VGTNYRAFYAGRMMSIKSRLQLEMVGGPDQAEPPREGAALCCVRLSR
jgi:hypothetical protein